MTFTRGVAVALIGSALVVSGCASSGGGSASGDVQTQEAGGFRLGSIFGGGRRGAGRAEDPGIGVNAYLWRASLDTIAFMPLVSADPWGGIIITDWYASPEKPDERFKATVYILDTRLRADALNVALFKQVRDGTGGWVDTAVTAQTETDIENAILTRARQLRLGQPGG